MVSKEKMVAENPEKPSYVLDCVGLYCPIPVLKTRQEIDRLAIGEILEVLADDPASEPDIKAWAKRAGQEIIRIDKEGNYFKFLIKKKQ